MAINAIESRLYFHMVDWLLSITGSSGWYNVGGLLFGQRVEHLTLMLFTQGMRKNYIGTQMGFISQLWLPLVAGILPNVPGFLATTGVVREVPLVFSVLCHNSWFVGFFLGAGCLLDSF